MPLLLRWFAETGHPDGRDPYFLYAVAALGSLTALVLYPVLIEPLFQVRDQSLMWMAGCGVAALLTTSCAGLLWAAPRVFGPRAEREPVTAPRGAQWLPALLRRLRWAALAAIPASLTLGLTTYVSTEVSVVPLFWILPFTLALFALMIAFTRLALCRLPSGARVTLHALYAFALLALLWLFSRGAPPRELSLMPPGAAGWLAVAAVGWILLVPQRWLFVLQPLATVALLYHFLTGASAVGALPLHLLGCYVACRACYGELARDRPAAEGVTEFFLWIALGGIAGGLFNGVVAPLLFSTIVEYWLALLLACLFRPGNAARGLSDALIMFLVGTLSGFAGRAQRALGSFITPLLDWLVPLAIRVLTMLWVRHGPRPVSPPLLCGLPLLLCLLTLGRRLRFTLAVGAVLLTLLPAIDPVDPDIPPAGLLPLNVAGWVLGTGPAVLLGLPVLGLLLVIIDLVSGRVRAIAERETASEETGSWLP